MTPHLHCDSCGTPIPPETVRFTLFLRSPQHYQGMTAAHYCAICGDAILKVSAVNLRKTRMAMRS